MQDNILARGLDQPYVKPLQWKNWESRLGVGMRPYDTPKDEYLQNRYAPTQNQLLYRWDGYDLECDIHLIYMDTTMPLQRAKIQQIKKREAGIPDLDNPEDRKIQRAYDIQMAQAHIDRLDQEISSGVEKVVEKTGSMMTGFTVVENWRPLSARSAKDKSQELRDWMKWRQVLEGSPSDITESLGESSLIEEMRKWKDVIGNPEIPRPPRIIELPAPEQESNDIY